MNRRTTAGLLWVQLALPACSERAPDPIAFADARDYEVWAIDQSDSPDAAFGGTLYVFDAADLMGDEPSAAQPFDRVDLAGAASSLCREKTGTDPVRPHMLLFNRDQTHAVISFVASGHVLIMDASVREPLDCFRTSRSPTGQQAHAAIPSPDGTYILVANQSGRRLERIDTDFRADRFVPRPDATLDLAACTTPSGTPCEAATVRPLNWPICPILDAAGDRGFVTLRGGGLIVVDPRRAPMAIVGEYDSTTVAGNGCGGLQVGEWIYITSGGSPVDVSGTNPAAPELYGFEVYRFPTGGYAAGNPVNSPAPTRVFSKTGQADAHGMVSVGGGEYLWVFDRHSGSAEILATRSDEHVASLTLTGALVQDAAPDLADVSPAGDRVFVALRGPRPLSGDPHNATGSFPGIGIVEVRDGGRTGELLGVVPVTNPDSAGVERADVHAVRVRRRPA